MGEVALYFAGLSAGIALLAMLMLYFGKRSIKKREAETRSVKAETVNKFYGDKMLGSEFFWAVWQGQSEFAEMTMLVRDEHDAVVTTIHRPNYILGSMARRWFEFDGKRYTQQNVSALSVRMEYCQQGNALVLYSSEQTLGKIYIYRRNTDVVLYTVLLGSVFSKYHRVIRGDQEVARIISIEKIDSHARAISCQPGILSPLERLILMTAL